MSEGKCETVVIVMLEEVSKAEQLGRLPEGFERDGSCEGRRVGIEDRTISHRMMAEMVRRVRGKLRGWTSGTRAAGRGAWLGRSDTRKRTMT